MATKRTTGSEAEEVVRRDCDDLFHARREVIALCEDLAGFFDAVADDDYAQALVHALGVFGDAECDGQEIAEHAAETVKAIRHLIDEHARPTEWARFSEGSRLSEWNEESPLDSAHAAVVEAASRLVFIVYFRHADAGLLPPVDPDGPPMTEVQRVATNLDWPTLRELFDGNDGKPFRTLARRVRAESRDAVAGVHKRLLLAAVAGGRRPRREAVLEAEQSEYAASSRPQVVASASVADEERITQLPERIRKRFELPAG